MFIRSIHMYVVYIHYDITIVEDTETQKLHDYG